MILECVSFSGQVSVQRCVLMVRQYRSRYKESVEAFIEESVVRRELADNFCYYNKHYDSIEGKPCLKKNNRLVHKRKQSHRSAVQLLHS